MGHLVHMTHRVYRQAVSDKKKEVTTNVFLTRLVKLACGMWCTNTHPALSVLIVHQAVVKRVMPIVLFIGQQPAGTSCSTVVCVLLMRTGQRMEAATMKSVINH